jgi:uncharacterized protein (DUF1778 family)
MDHMNAKLSQPVAAFNHRDEHAGHAMAKTAENSLAVVVRPMPAYTRHPVSIRLSASERKTIGAAAEIKGQWPSEYIRRAALAAAGAPLAPAAARRDALAKQVAAAVGLLGRIASSANQIARIANSGGMQPTDVKAVLDRLNRQLFDIHGSLIDYVEDRRA